MKNLFIYNKRKAGFTLIEVMVSVSIFTIISTIGIGALLSMNNAYKRSRSQRTAVDSLTFILDSMSRDIRTGSQYSCGGSGDCYDINGSDTFSFRDQDNRMVKYTFNTTDKTIERVIDNGTSENITTPETVSVENLSFRMKSESAPNQQNDMVQPFVVISIFGEATYAQVVTPLRLQTSVTQRLLDFPVGS